MGPMARRAFSSVMRTKVVDFGDRSALRQAMSDDERRGKPGPCRFFRPTCRCFLAPAVLLAKS